MRILTKCYNEDQRKMLFHSPGYCDYALKYERMYLNVYSKSLIALEESLLICEDHRYKLLGESLYETNSESPKKKLLECIVSEYVEFIKLLIIEINEEKNNFVFVCNLKKMYKNLIHSKYNKNIKKIKELNPFVYYYIENVKTITSSYHVSPLNFYFPLIKNKKSLLFYKNIENVCHNL